MVDTWLLTTSTYQNLQNLQNPKNPQNPPNLQNPLSLAGQSIEFQRKCKEFARDSAEN